MASGCSRREKQRVKTAQGSGHESIHFADLADAEAKRAKLERAIRSGSRKDNESEDA
jgi:hypothetical protein